jgi:hypothetical protein
MGVVKALVARVRRGRERRRWQLLPARNRVEECPAMRRGGKRSCAARGRCRLPEGDGGLRIVLAPPRACAGAPWSCVVGRVSSGCSTAGRAPKDAVGCRRRGLDGAIAAAAGEGIVGGVVAGVGVVVVARAAALLPSSSTAWFRHVGDCLTR